MRAPTMATVNRERILLVGGQRALLMQLAHPLVAAGVAHHSDFPARALDRLRRTLDLSLALIYGNDGEAAAASRSIQAVHDRVTGTAEGTRYAANDPGLLAWVNATLIDTSLVVYERFVRPLRKGERRGYYLESVESAAMFGIPREAMPPTLEDFERYRTAMLRGDVLRATAESRRLVGDVLRPPLPLPLKAPTAVVRQITLALLPAAVRDLFGLRAGPVARAALAASSAASRAALPWVPPVVREFARARAAESTRIGA